MSIYNDICRRNHLPREPEIRRIMSATGVDLSQYGPSSEENLETPEIETEEECTDNAETQPLPVHGDGVPSPATTLGSPWEKTEDAIADAEEEVKEARDTFLKHTEGEEHKPKDAAKETITDASESASTTQKQASVEEPTLETKDEQKAKTLETKDEQKAKDVSIDQKLPARPSSWNKPQYISPDDQCPAKKRGRKPKAKEPQEDEQDEGKKRGRSTTKGGKRTKRKAETHDEKQPRKTTRNKKSDEGCDDDATKAPRRKARKATATSSKPVEDDVKEHQEEDESKGAKRRRTKASQDTSTENGTAETADSTARLTPAQRVGKYLKEVKARKAAAAANAAATSTVATPTAATAKAKAKARTAKKKAAPKQPAKKPAKQQRKVNPDTKAKNARKSKEYRRAYAATEGDEETKRAAAKKDL
eukprot:Skav214667  [mRNA]  locus=scaffold923:252845:254881:- [translate_table: standard]